MDHDNVLADDDVQQAAPWRALSLRQQWGLGAAAGIVLVGLLWMVGSSASGDLVVLPTGHPLTPETVRQLTADFRAAGLSGFEQDGQRLLVPSADLERYTALLPQSTTTTDHWASEWERQNQQLTPFSSSRAREATREIARAKLITGMLQKLPDIQQADVVWDEDEQPGWRRSPQSRATVYLMPHPGRLLTLDVIRSVRQAVAGSKKNLDPTDVVVLDLARQQTYEGELPATAGEELLPAVRSLAELYRREITQQVHDLQEAEVDVRVDLPRFFAYLAEHPDDAERQLSSAAPGLLRVTIHVPAGSSLSATEATHRRLRERIVTLTGIGRSSMDGDSIVIRFEQSSHVAATTAPFLGTGWPFPELPAGPPPHLLLQAAGGLLVVAFALLWGRRLRQRRHHAAASFPALQAIGPSPLLRQFDDLSQCDRATLRAAYSHATPRRWAVALRGSSCDVREHLADALDPASADELRGACEQLGPVTLADIESSRQRIVESIDPGVQG